MKLAILTDSAANLSSTFIQQHSNLFVVPLMIVIDEKTYRDQVEISAQEVYEKLDEHRVSTSLPNRQDVEKVLQQIKDAGYQEVLCINVSSGLSGTYNFFRLLFEEVSDLTIHHFDSKTLAGGQGQLVEYALELADKEVPAATILEKLHTTRFHHSIAFYTIQTLKYLKRGGRIGKVEATIGEVLHVKPVITVNDDGVYITLAKAFGIQRSLIHMLKLLSEKFGKRLIDLTIHFGDDEEKAHHLQERLQKELNVRNCVVTPLTPVLGVHTGASIFAYCAREILAY